MNIPFRRGNDGLTDRQRAKCAKRYREGAGRVPTKDEFQRLRALTAATHRHGAWCHPSADGCPDRPGM